MDWQHRLLYDKSTRSIVAASKAWVCGVRKQGDIGGNDPDDCNWPFCGCDPYANKVIETIEESGFKIAKLD